VTPRSARREDLAEAATDHVLEHGLVGLSLRPLAAALGTSDRMLLYHFRDKDDLVSTLLRVSNERAMAAVRALVPSPDVRVAVLTLWRTVTAAEQDKCQRLYVEAAALGLLGREPYASVVREANAAWVRTVADYLVASGMPERLAARAVVLVDAAFMGFQLDLPLDTDPREVEQAVADLADAVAGIASATGQGGA
jgi:AcrR family transcriptional regulator